MFHTSSFFNFGSDLPECLKLRRRADLFYRQSREKVCRYRRNAILNFRYPADCE